ncbi:MAG: HDOD domain-containing protein [Archangium sp.]
MDLAAALEERVARKAVHLLPQPQSALRLRNLVASPRHSLKDVVAAVMLDPMLAAAVMRIANSAAFARGGATTNLATAVQRIGEKELSRIALASSLNSSSNAAGPLLTVRREVMQRALTAAVLCERLAKFYGLDPEPMFLAGLLHDVGVLVALGTLELICSQHRNLPARSSDEWLALAMKKHVELGSMLAQHWGLPPQVAEAISQHHSSGALSAGTALVRLSDELCAVLESGQALTVEHPSLALFDDETREAIVGVLTVLPSTVAAFSSDSPLASSPSLVAAEPADAHEGIAYTARLGRARTAKMWIQSAQEIHLEVSGTENANQLEELEFAPSSAPVKMWVRITRVEPRGEHSMLVAVPFSPTPELLALLAELAFPMERAA